MLLFLGRVEMVDSLGRLLGSRQISVRATIANLLWQFSPVEAARAAVVLGVLAGLKEEKQSAVREGLERAAKELQADLLD